MNEEDKVEGPDISLPEEREPKEMTAEEMLDEIKEKMGNQSGVPDDLKIDAGRVVLQLKNAEGEAVEANLVQVLNQIIMEMGKMVQELDAINEALHQGDRDAGRIIVPR
jgi:hypothetical protein